MVINKLEAFLQGIQAKQNYPQGLQLNLGGVLLGDAEVKAIAIALQSDYCPQGLQLELVNAQLGDEGTAAIAMALQSGHCPQQLQLNLRINKMGDKPKFRSQPR